MPRGIKRFFYLLFYLIVVFGIGFGIYWLFLKPAPSCFDNKQNGEEEGIDCGTVCGKVCLPTSFRPIELTGQVTTFAVDESHTSLLFKIQNPNPEVAARTIRYRTEIFDGSDMAVYALQGSSFAYPGEIKYIFVPLVPVAQDKVVDLRNFSTAEVDWVESASFKKPDAFVQRHETVLEGTHARTEGTFVNRDAAPLPSVELVALYYGTDGQIATVSHTELQDVRPGETRPFTILSAPLPRTIDLARTEIFVAARRP